MKKIMAEIKPALTILLVFSMLFSIAPMAFADGEIELSASQLTVDREKSDELEISINITNLVSVTNLNFIMSYDKSAFTVSEVALVESELVDKLNLEVVNSTTKGQIKVIGNPEALLSADVTDRLTIATMKFKVNSSAEYKAYPLNFKDVYFIKVVNNERVPLTVNLVNGSITVKKPSSGSSVNPGAGLGYVNSPSPSASPSPSPSVSPSPSPDSSPDGAAKFDDLDGYDWAKEAIDILVKRGIIKGTSETKYEPERNITRAEFSKLIVTAFGFDDIDDTKTFTDVNKDDWYYSVVLAAAKSGIVTGYEDGGFKPNAPITREEMAVILVRAFKAAEIEVPDADMTFADADEMGEWSKEFISALAKLGIVGGRGNNMFVPKANLTRAEAAKVIFSSLGLLEE